MANNLNDLTRQALRLHAGLGLVTDPSQYSDNFSLFWAELIDKRPDVLAAKPTLTLRCCIHMQACWLACGMPVFQIDENLLAGLLLTDAGSVTAEEWHMPYGTFAVLLPSGFWQMENLCTPGAMSNAWCVIFHRYHTLTKAIYQGDARLQTYLQAYITNEDGSEIWQRSLPPTSGALEPWLLETRYGVAEGDVVEPTSEYEATLLQACKQLVVNLSLLIAEQGPGKRVVTPVRNKAKLRRLKKNASSNASRGPSALGPQAPEVWQLGKVALLSAELIAAAKACGRAKERTEWKISKRFTVRGHWREQAYGKGGLLRRRKWIAPYWKGAGVKLAHLYTMDVDKGEGKP